jgi:hypothetical protein
MGRLILTIFVVIYCLITAAIAFAVFHAGMGLLCIFAAGLFAWDIIDYIRDRKKHNDEDQRSK